MTRLSQIQVTAVSDSGDGRLRSDRPVGRGSSLRAQEVTGPQGDARRPAGISTYPRRHRNLSPQGAEFSGQAPQNVDCSLLVSAKTFQVIQKLRSVSSLGFRPFLLPLFSLQNINNVNKGTHFIGQPMYGHTVPGSSMLMSFTKGRKKNMERAKKR